MNPACLSRCRLYAIVDLGYVQAGDAPAITKALVAGGADLVQLRAKGHSPAEIADLARELHQITRDRGVPLIINDHPGIARDMGAEGVHVGQDDLTVADARAIVGTNRMVGKSTHSLDQAVTAFYEGADYIGFGPIFATATKPDYQPIGLDAIAAVHDAVRLPIFCIGGIKLDNLPKVIEAGAQRVVIVSGLLQATDVAGYGRAVKDLLTRNSKLETGKS